VKKEVTELGYVVLIELNKNVADNVCCRASACRYVGCILVIATAHGLYGSYVCQRTALYSTELRTLSKIPGFAQIS